MDSQEPLPTSSTSNGSNDDNTTAGGVGSTENCSYVNGVYTYIEPTSKNEFIWDTELQQWKPSKVSGNPVSFDGSSYTYTDVSDGTVFEYDPLKSAWFPKLDDEMMARYQLSYGVPVDSSQDPKIENPPPPKPESAVDKSGLKRKGPTTPSWFDLEDEKNTKVYVSNLPLDITEPEFSEFMSKCGLIMKDPTTGDEKIKLYSEPDGSKKGDGLCTYIKIESVHLALQILDGADLRGHKVKVERAQFQLKGAYDPSKKPKSKKRKEKEKLKKKQEKLFEWKPEKMRGERSKHERIVIVQNAFTPSDFDADVGLILEYQQDFREEAGKCGTCKKVTVFDRHPEGVLQITMSSPEEADAVVGLFNDRFFGGKKISAFIYDGHTKYKIDETEAEREDRLKNWEKFIGDGGGEKSDGPGGAAGDGEKATPPATPPNEADEEDDE